MTVSPRCKVVLLLAVALACVSCLALAEEAPPDIGAVAPSPPGLVPSTLSVEQAIGIALQYNPTVAIAQEGVWVSRGQVIQALSYLGPRLEVSSQRVTPVNLPPFTFQSRTTTYNTTFSLSQPLYTAGSLRQGVEAARNVLHGSQATHDRAKQQIAFLVRGNYYAVLTAEEGVKVAEEVVSSAEEHLRVARLRYEAGVAPQYDVLAAEARVARVQQELISARASRDTNWASFSTALGVSLPAGTKLSTPPRMSVTEAGLADLTQEALAQRPDIKVARAEVATAKAQVSIARAARKPTVSASIDYSLLPKTTVAGEQLGLPPGTELVVSQSSGALSVSANWSLFNAGQVTGEIRAAQARLRQAEQGVEVVRLQVGLDVKTAYLALEATQASLLAAHKETEQAQEAHRIATLRYQEGVGTSVEILDAEANLEGAKTRLNQAIYGLNLAVAQLDLALGRQFAPATSAAPSAAPARG